MKKIVDCGGQFFKVENYLLNNYERYGLRDKYIRIILKLMCYYRVSVHWGDWIEQPTSEQIAWSEGMFFRKAME